MDYRNFYNLRDSLEDLIQVSCVPFYEQNSETMNKVGNHVISTLKKSFKGFMFFVDFVKL